MATPLTSTGYSSLRSSQRMGPRLISKKAMYSTRQATAVLPLAAPPSMPKLAARPAQDSAMPAHPTSSSGLRPTLSISASATSTNTSLATPMYTVCTCAASLEEPADSKIWGAKLLTAFTPTHCCMMLPMQPMAMLH